MSLFIISKMINFKNWKTRYLIFSYWIVKCSILPPFLNYWWTSIGAQKALGNYTQYIFRMDRPITSLPATASIVYFELLWNLREVGLSFYRSILAKLVLFQFQKNFTNKFGKEVLHFINFFFDIQNRDF